MKPRHVCFTSFLILETLLLLCTASVQTWAQERPGEEKANDPCSGPTALFALLNRPTVADSACVAKPGNVVLETGFQRQVSRDALPGTLTTYPNADVRIGLPRGWELDVLPPNWNIGTGTEASGSLSRVAGFGDVGFGAKYEIGQFHDVLLAIDTVITVPSGANAFRSRGTQAAVNGIFAYSLTPRFGIGGELSVATLTGSSGAQPGRFTLLTPDLVATYQMPFPLQFYGELYGTGDTGGVARNYWFDGGVQYLITSRWEADIEAGVLVHSTRGTASHYFGFGFGFLF
ncbi:MAG TPA: hypothetical protein VJ770_22370 [Stellaceae bacterium]|nr:hypothetical protein [Stellaceae bacterium]